MKTLLTTFVGFLIMISMNAQVGINIPNPTQALDVNGKIKLTDDSATPSAGTLRYNETNLDFEGHNGSGWKSFTQSKSGIPSNAKVVIGILERLDNNSYPDIIPFKDENSSTELFTKVPAGKFLLITHISIGPSSLVDIINEDPFYSILIDYKGGSRLYLRGKHTGGSLYQNNAGYAPLGVVRSGVELTITNFRLSESLEQFDSGVDIYIVGLLVDDLNFNN